ncbi:Oidioi.mRNA.OKI2018_I69.chr1.g1013.t1.cds [Oikopleura dioica]|uniref:Oidioi.mRNA.OKI2018_I69.chr1.g1013.t1.cds n=1 Tax=Oikopleura dioica TaxID=34765 RepID=A0ABN7SLM3_OIKDI|nr:Oidioi.mRNA.OKI2018_I69.chr1.g1013.t1.cds [Oikopleura dioica]
MDELESALTPPETGDFDTESDDFIEDTLNELSDFDEEINFDAFENPNEVRQRLSRRESRLSQVSQTGRKKGKRKGQRQSKVWKKGWQRKWTSSKR